jgi:beta-lactam-binding protein with PASTA domain
VVPSVVGKTQAAAEADILAANLAVGTVQRVKSAQRGVVLAQSPAPGTILPAGSKVNITVGK